MKTPVTMIVVGAGGRGTTYASFALQQPGRLKITGVAEPQEFFRNRMAQQHQIPPERVFRTWKDLVRQPRLADGVIIATLDDMHAEPTVALAKHGYHILVEKPMAPTKAECARMVAAAKKAKVMLGVCHVLRYTSYTRKLKEVLDSGAIGDIVSIQHLEPVGYWHQAHSFVRGKWRNEEESTFMLMAKSCHDLDWIRHIMGRPCQRVASFGSLHHFRKEHRPRGAAARCLDCKVERQCPYSAKKIYLDRFKRGEKDWPVNVAAPVPTRASLLKALRTGPYGRCVYLCDNDVVDQQVVIMEFEGGRTANFTMTAFAGGHRMTRVFGTRGEAYCDCVSVRHFDFLTDTWHEHDIESHDSSILGGHGGGDFMLMDAFTQAIATRNPALILSGAEESFETHASVFAAEESRRTGRVVKVK